MRDGLPNQRNELRCLNRLQNGEKQAVHDVHFQGPSSKVAHPQVLNCADMPSSGSAAKVEVQLTAVATLMCDGKCSSFYWL